MQPLSLHAKYFSAALCDRLTNSIPYVGYSANANLGDVELFNLFSRYSGLNSFSFQAWKRGRYAALGVRNGQTALVGGGTLIFSDEILAELEFLIKKGLKPYYLGTGVPDDFPEPETLSRWKEIFSKTDDIWVRGHHSKEMMGKMGIEANVLGDLGYLLNLDFKQPEVMEDYAVIVLRAIRPTNYDLFKQDFHTRELVSELAKHLKDQGILTKIMAVSIDDFPVTRSKTRAHLKDFEYIEYHGDFMGIVNELAKARLVVSMRLHPGIFALATGTRVIELEKRRKFHDSFNVFPDDGNFYDILDPTKLTADELKEKAMNVWEKENGNIREQRFTEVTKLARSQKQFCENVGKLLK